MKYCFIIKLKIVIVMRNFLLKSLLLICAVTFFSCDNMEDVAQNSDLSENSIEVLDNNIVRFKNSETYHSIVDRLMLLNEADRLNYMDSLGFNSQYVLLRKSDKELEDICEVVDPNLFSEKYGDFRKKYNDIFMFNDIDLEDLSAYSKIIDPAHELFSNNKGEFLIGDSLIKSKLFESFSDFSKDQLVITKTDASDYNPNHAGGKKDKRKVGLHMSLGSDGSVYSNFTAQKKNVFGWVRYSTVYLAKFNLFGPFVFRECREFGYANERYVHKLNFEVTTIELGGNTTVKLGTIGTATLPPPAALPSLTGSMEIWSRGVPYENRGKGSIKLPL